MLRQAAEAAGASASPWAAYDTAGGGTPLAAAAAAHGGTLNSDSREAMPETREVGVDAHDPARMRHPVQLLACICAAPVLSSLSGLPDRGGAMRAHGRSRRSKVPSRISSSRGWGEPSRRQIIVTEPAANLLHTEPQAPVSLDEAPAPPRREPPQERAAAQPSGDLLGPPGLGVRLRLLKLALLLLRTWPRRGAVQARGRRVSVDRVKPRCGCRPEGSKVGSAGKGSKERVSPAGLGGGGLSGCPHDRYEHATCRGGEASPAG